MIKIVYCVLCDEEILEVLFYRLFHAIRLPFVNVSSTRFMFMSCDSISGLYVGSGFEIIAYGKLFL
jgi:hypothetical protein